MVNAGGKILRKVIVIILIVATIGNVMALPEILDIFNTKYNTAGTRLDSCDTCHIQGVQNATNLNPYGMDIKDNLSKENVLILVEPLDSDKDGFTNIEEIRNLTFPGNKIDFPGVIGVTNTPIVIMKSRGTIIANENTNNANENTSIEIANESVSGNIGSGDVGGIKVSGNGGKIGDTTIKGVPGLGAIYIISIFIFILLIRERFIW